MNISILNYTKCTHIVNYSLNQSLKKQDETFMKRFSSVKTLYEKFTLSQKDVLTPLVTRQRLTEQLLRYL